MIAGDRLGRTSSLLPLLLRSCYDLAAAGDGKLTVGGQGPQLLLFSAEEADVVRAPAPIVILPQELEEPPSVTLPGDSILVLDSQNRCAVSFAARSGLRILDCGLASRDTLTFSSFSKEDAVVCLQRPVEDRAGQTVEPFELPLHLSRHHPAYPLLCCAAVLILSGRWEALDGLTL